VRTAKEMLDVLDEFFVTAGEEQARNLWAVLSALRGPDDDSYVLKNCTTEVVRAVAFPRLAALWKRELCAVGPTFNLSSRLASIPPNYSPRYNHFFNHIADAKRVLQRMNREPVASWAQDENNKEA